jgi:hypothetical protein
VIPGLKDLQIVAENPVDKTVFPGDPAGQAPASPYFNGSGLPMPSNGERDASAMSLLIRLTIERSTDCQCR